MKFLFLTLLAFSFTAHAADRSITVQGNCLRSSQPDRGSVEFYSEAINMDTQKALATANKNFEAARDAVKKLNLKDMELSTVENSLQEERSWENNKSIMKGFKARIGLRVYTSQIERLSEVFSVVSKQGIKNFGSLQVDLSPAKLKAEQEACLETAIQNAKVKADKMAKAAGAKVGKVLTLQEGSAASPGPRPVHFAKSMMADGAAEMAAPIDTKAETISSSVTATYSLD